MTSCTSLPWPAPACAVLPFAGSSPLSTPLMTNCWMLLGRPSACSRDEMSEESLEETSAPSTATPVIAPTSRLVLVVEAAIPERSGGTADSAEEVAGTTVLPTPMPATDSAAASGRYPGCGLIVNEVSSSPSANSTQPVKMDHFGPAAIVH